MYENKNISQKIIFHIDVNSAFLSWSAVERMNNGDSIDLRKIPSIVGGDETSRRGVVLAKSIPAKKYGIRTGESTFSARKKYPNLVMVKPDFNLYQRCSREMMNIFKAYTPIIQKFSIDECFLEFSNLVREKDEPRRLACEIKEKIKKELGFTVNVGISTNKLLAKMASDFQKPDMIHTLYKEEIEKKMWTLPVEELFMVGRRTVPKLNNLNIFTIGDLAKYDINILKDKFKSSGVLMWNYANGIDNSKVKSESKGMKVISNSVTLTQDITTREEAHNVLYRLVEDTSARLRKLKKCCYVISVTIRDSEFSDYSHGRKLNSAVDSTKEIGSTVCKLFDDMWKGEAIRLLGIALSQLTEEQIMQISLFDDGYNNIKKQKVLDSTIDSIRNKYGNDAVLKFGKLTKSKKVK